MSKFTRSNDAEDDEEWRRNHAGGRTEEVPEPADNRSLFERLQEQKAAKEDAYNEATKFSNLIRRLDNDEIDFLVSVTEQRQAEESKKARAQRAAVERFRTAQRELDSLQRQDPAQDSETPKGSSGRRTDLPIEGPSPRPNGKRRAMVDGVVVKDRKQRRTDGSREVDGATTRDADAISAVSPPEASMAARRATSPRGRSGLIAYTSDSEDE